MLRSLGSPSKHQRELDFREVWPLINNWSWGKGINESWILHSLHILGVLSFAYESREGLTSCWIFIVRGSYSRSREWGEWDSWRQSQARSRIRSLFVFESIPLQLTWSRLLTCHMKSIACKSTPTPVFSFFIVFVSCNHSLNHHLPLSYVIQIPKRP